jgi:hypothetical protein
MPRTDLLEQSATRVELDQRSREARLRLERVQRLLLVRPLPRQSLLRRVLRRLGSRGYIGGRIASETANRTRGNGRPREKRATTGKVGGVSGGLSAAPPVPWALSSKCRMAAGIASRPVAVSNALVTGLGVRPWDHPCRRGDFDALALSGDRS